MGKRKRTVIVQLRDGSALKGVLAGWSGRRREMILWAPRLISAVNPEVEVAGHVEVPRENIRYWQVVE